MMMWLPLAMLTAFFEAVKDAFSKRGLSQIDEYVLTWALSVLTVLFLLPVFLITGMPTLQPQFWLALLLGGTLNTLAFSLYVSAIKQSDLSLTLPIINFTPLFLLITSPLIVHESLTPFDAVGGVLIVAGSYVLNLKAGQRSLWSPLQALVQEPGPKLMLGVALIWSVTSNFDKVGVQNSSPLFWAVSLFGFMAIALLPVVLRRSPRHLKVLPQQLGLLLPIGLFSAMSIFCQMNALNFTQVVNVIAIKRTSTLIAALFGFLIFQEQGIRQRSAGAVIMIVGVIVITQA